MIWQDALNSVLLSWQGTPYKAGQQLKGPHGGVDCVRFVDGVMRELHAGLSTHIPRISQDLSLYDPAGVIRIVHQLVKQYPCRVLAGHEPLEPGDVFLIRPTPSAGPGHVLIAGTLPKVWHAIHHAGVCFTGIGAVENIWKIYRPTEKASWAIPSQSV